MDIRRALGRLVLVLPAVALFVAHVNLDGWALYTEEQVLNANVLHPLFRTEAHFAGAYWRPEMTQRERLQGIARAYNCTVEALAKVGINAFLESSSLIGLLRHKGHMPWESDGDVGVVESECRSSGATKAKLAEVMDTECAVLKFACACEEDCEGDDARMAGKVAHKGTGVVVDIFMYAPVREARDWQKNPRHSSQEWWERVNDHADYTFPRDVLLPLQNGTFEGVSIPLPNKPREFLSWEYGGCLGAHIWPWRILLYSTLSVLVPCAVIAKGAALVYGPRPAKKNSYWLASVSGAYAALAMGGFQGGISLLLLAVTWLCELLAVFLDPELLGAGCASYAPLAVNRRRRHRLSLLVAFAVLLLELRGCVGQLMCSIDDYYIHPLRPKFWTLCLFGQCWDFSVGI